jgi:hypothetical protein
VSWPFFNSFPGLFRTFFENGVVSLEESVALVKFSADRRWPVFQLLKRTYKMVWRFLVPLKPFQDQDLLQNWAVAFMETAAVLLSRYSVSY